MCYLSCAAIKNLAKDTMIFCPTNRRGKRLSALVGAPVGAEIWVARQRRAFRFFKKKARKKLPRAAAGCSAFKDELALQRYRNGGADEIRHIKYGEA